MKILFSHNKKLRDCEEQAEFDTPETIAWITKQLEELGHTVLPMDVSQPLSWVLSEIDSFQPDLIFNTAEGHRGRVREGFFPSIFEELAIPYTGSNAYTCNLTLDKDLTRYKVSNAGIPVAKGFMLQRLEDISRLEGMTFPLFLKPNFEGSSKGIGDDSIVKDQAELKEKVEQKLKRFCEGVMIEEYIPGKDVTVAFLEGMDSKKNRVLVPCDYSFAKDDSFYNYELKNNESDSVTVRCPADLPQKVLSQLHNYAEKIFQLLEIRDLGRIDFRVTPNGEIFFLEINALPSLEMGAGIYLGAKARGLESEAEVLRTVLKSASRRYGLDKGRKKARTTSKTPKIGFAFNVKRVVPNNDMHTDDHAEFDSMETINAIAGAIENLGHEVVKIEADGDFIKKLIQEKVDIVFNIAEGFRGRYRESQIPAVLDLTGVEYTGSDPSTLSLALDKGLAKRIVREGGINTADFCTLASIKDKLPKDLKFPLMVKPVAEGSSKGIVPGSVVSNVDELNELLPKLFNRYRQPVLLEAFLPGREFTVGVFGDRKIHAMSPMEIVFQNPTEKFPIYTYQHKIDAQEEVKFEVPAKLEERLENQIKQLAIKAFQALGCRDVARIDIRLDAKGKPAFIECNPLPGLSPGFSDICLIAQADGLSYGELINKILQPAIRRFRMNQKAKH